MHLRRLVYLLALLAAIRVMPGLVPGVHAANGRVDIKTSTHVSARPTALRRDSHPAGLRERATTVLRCRSAPECWVEQR